MSNVRPHGMSAIVAAPYRRPLVVVVALLTVVLPRTSLAGTSDPGGVVGSIIFLAFYLLSLGAVLIALLVAIARRRRVACNWLGAVLALGVAAPLTLAAYDGYRRETLGEKSRLALQAAEAEEAKYAAGLAEYCGTKPLIYAEPELEVHEGLRLSYGSGFTGRHADIDQQQVAVMLRRASCSIPTIAYVEFVVAGEKKRVEVCPPNTAVGLNQEPRFLVLLGESGRRDQLPWGPGGSKSVSKSSVRVHDRKTGNVVSEDVLVFKAFASASNCDDPITRLNRLLHETFR
jgi:hypothetical protein